MSLEEQVVLMMDESQGAGGGGGDQTNKARTKKTRRALAKERFGKVLLQGTTLQAKKHYSSLEYFSTALDLGEKRNRRLQKNRRKQQEKEMTALLKINEE